MISVVIADDQPLIRAALRALIDSEAGVEVVGEAESGEQAVELVRALRPNVIVMDIQMPDLDGVQACHRIRSESLLDSSRILMLTTFESDENVVRAIRAGANGFLGKSSDLDSLVDAIRVLARGEALLSPRATRALIERFVVPDGQRPEHPGLALLTGRELQILKKVALGHTNVEIAIELSISPATTKTHVNRMMAKVGAHDRGQLVVFAHEAGLFARGRT